MILQLLSLLDTSSDKRVSIGDHGFGRENFLNPVENWTKNRVYSISEKSPKLNKKNEEKKPGTWSMKNLLNLIRKQGRKPIICCYFAEGEKPPKSS